MRVVYYSLLLSFVCIVVNFQSCKSEKTQKLDQNINISSSNDFNIPSFYNEGSITMEFSSLSEKTNLSLFIYNYSKNDGGDFIKQIFRDSLYRNGSSKIYTVIEQSQKNVNINILQIEKYKFTQQVKAVSDKKNLINAFNSESNIEHKIVPIALLIDYEDENDEKAISAIERILECRQLEDFNESDIEYLRNKSNLLTVITYKIESEE